jgi:hypothetical protein
VMHLVMCWGVAVVAVHWWRSSRGHAFSFPCSLELVRGHEDDAFRIAICHALSLPILIVERQALVVTTQLTRCPTPLFHLHRDDNDAAGRPFYCCCRPSSPAQRSNEAARRKEYQQHSDPTHAHATPPNHYSEARRRQR